MTLLATELQPTKTYPFSALRYQSQHDPAQEGVFAAGDMLVAQRAAGTNMSVDVAAGASWVQGDDAARQGYYHQINDASVNVAVGAAHATLPRLDQIVLQLADSSVLGGSDTPLLMVIAGTATSGATLDNRTGAAALPNTCIRLGDLLVPGAATQIVNANIRDRRPWCRGAARKQGTGTGHSTSSATDVPIDDATLLMRVECSGAPINLEIQGVFRLSGAGDFGTSVYIDGALTLPDWSFNDRCESNSPNLARTFRDTNTSVPPGSHLFSPRWHSNGTLTLSNQSIVQFRVLEDPRQDSNNNPAGYG